MPGFLTVTSVLSQFADDAERATREYRRFVKEGRGVEVWDELRHGILLGSDEFMEQLRPLLAGQATRKEISRRERLAGRPSLAALFAGVEDKRERDERIHRAVRSHEYTLKEIGDFLGLYYSTIGVTAKRVDEAPRYQERRSDSHSGLLSSGFARNRNRQGVTPPPATARWAGRSSMWQPSSHGYGDGE